MATYEVEMRYTSYTTITVEAADMEQAESIAWTEANASKPYGDWDAHSITEIKEPK